MSNQPGRRRPRGRRRIAACCCALALNIALVGSASVPIARPPAIASSQTALHDIDWLWNGSGKEVLLFPRQRTGGGSESLAASTNPQTASASSTTDPRTQNGDSSLPTRITGSASSPTATVIASIVATTTVTRTASATAAISTSTSVPVNYQLPQAFDTTLGTNFTGTACPSFFETFLADPVFNACAPLSLLLTTSNAFFTAQRSPYSLLPFVLDASCSADNSTCSALMSQLATNIKRQNACGPDLNKGNPLVTEALQGFQNYNLLREAGCQRNAETNQYCLAEACAAPNPDELYFYYLPAGTSLPSGTQPSCSSCPSQLLKLFSTFAQNSTLTISKVYPAARTLSNQVCGPNFAPPSTLSAATSDSTRLFATSMSLGLFLFVAIFSIF